MVQNLPTAVTVEYEYVDGAHFFTSSDPFARGLCAASVSLREAYNDVTVQLRELARLNHGVDLVCEPAKPFEEFRNEVIKHLENEIVKSKIEGNYPVP